MKKSTRFLGLALTGALALVLPLNAEAACGTPLAFGSYYSFVTGTLNGPALRSNFWLLNNGNPGLAAGIDNGNVNETGIWLVPYPAGQTTLAVLSSWAAQAGYDGCPEGAAPVDQMRMVMTFSDVDLTGSPTFAVACVHRDPTAGIEFDFTRPAAAPLALVPAQRAAITNTVRAGNEATITVAPPNFAAGFYTDGSSGCDLATVIPQFEVYKQQTGRGVPADPTNDTGSAWVLVATCASSGSPACVVTTTCGTTNCDNYLAVVPKFNSGFTTAEAATGSPARVSAKSANVQAGPTLAVTPKSKIIRNEKVGGKQIQQ
jgi:hypothetical protein